MGWLEMLVIVASRHASKVLIQPIPTMNHPHRSINRFLLAAMLLFPSTHALAINAVYLESNAEDSNEVALLIQDNDGAPLNYIEAYPTGGKGEPAIDGNQAHALATNGKYLFVTNTGDDSITTFGIGRLGRLTLIARTPALGHYPVSLTVVQNNLIVLNQGNANTKTLVNAKVQRFRILQDGQLVALQGNYTYLPYAVPVDVIGSSNGHTFSVTLSGLSQIDTFALEKDGSISRTGTTSGISNPLGGTMGRYDPRKLAVTLADESLPGVSSLFTARNGLPQRIFQNIRPSLIDPCWAVSNAQSTWLWTSAFKTRTLSLYQWSTNGGIRLISDFTPELAGPGGLDLAISRNDKTLYWLRVGDVNNAQQRIRPYIESFAVDIMTFKDTAGLSLISKTLLPESWSYASPGGILSAPIQR